MAKTGLAQDERFQRHDTGPEHPERPERLARIADELDKRGITAACQPISAQEADQASILLNHDPAYVARLAEACKRGAPSIDVPDSAICPGSETIARLAVGTALRAVDMVMHGEVDNAFCALRPPGHHAERALSMGFCLYNNIAIAARHLLETHHQSRVLILDWDVHHGNGTQHSFESDPRVLFISLHGHPGVVYPGTGHEHERGKDAGEGFTLNIPMLPPSSDGAYRRAFDEIVLPAIDKFNPEFILLSAGFDAHRLDPLAPLELETASFGWMTDVMTAAAKEHCQGRLVSLLEGGYHLDALAESVALHVTQLLQAR